MDEVGAEMNHTPKVMFEPETSSSDIVVFTVIGLEYPVITP